MDYVLGYQVCTTLLGHLYLKPPASNSKIGMIFILTNIWKVRFSHVKKIIVSSVLKWIKYVAKILMLCHSIDLNWFWQVQIVLDQNKNNRLLHFELCLKHLNLLEGQGIRFPKPFLVQTNFPKYRERKFPFI